VLLAQVRAADDVSVKADGLVNLAPAAKQVAKRQVRLGGLGIDLGEFEKDLDGLVGLLVEQVVETPEVI